MIYSVSRSIVVRYSRILVRGTIFCALLLTAACAKDDSGSPENSEFRELSFEQLSGEGTIGEDNKVSIEFELRNEATSIQLVAQSLGRNLAVEGLFGPSDDLLFDPENSFDAASTVADSLQRNVVTFNFPIVGQAELAPLAKGNYRIDLEAAPLSRQEYTGEIAQAVNLAILVKNDNDVTRGVIPVKIFQSRTFTASQDSQNAFANALDVTREILARGGLSIATSFVNDTQIPESLRSPALGDAIYQRQSLGKGGFIPLYVVSTVTGLNSPLNSIAQAGSIPGALIPTERSGIAVSISAAGGSDRIIDSEDDRNDPAHTSEVRLLGEALAHEILHYLGLVDTIVFNGGNASDADVTDSPKCISIEECRFDPDAPQNIMFPFPLDRRRFDTLEVDQQDENIPRQFLSTLQTVIAQLAVGTE